MSVSANSRIGTEMAGYRLESLFGRGGMGLFPLEASVRFVLICPWWGLYPHTYPL